MPKTVFITGAGGFVGRNLLEYLSPTYHVLAMGHTELDLLNTQAVEDFFKKNKIDVILHCANIGGSRKTNYDVGNTDVVEQNLRMFLNLERCLTADMQMIHFGSGAEYDRSNYTAKMPEEYFDVHVPTDVYGYSKYVISKIIEKSNNMVCFRIFGLFGKYEDYRFKFISNAIVKNLLKMPIVINQNVTFDYLYINDFCKIIQYFIENQPQYKHYNITPSSSIDLLSAANLINEISDYKSDIEILNQGMNSEYSGSNKRIMGELPELGFTDYREAIHDLYKYYRSVLEVLDTKMIEDDLYLKACMVKK